MVYCVAQGSVFKTADAGDQWFPLNLDQSVAIADIAIDPSDSSVLLALPSGTPSLAFKSTDAGDTWSPRSLSTQASSPEQILWDKGRPNRVFFLAFQGVFRSLNMGESWDLLTPAVSGSVTALALDSSSGALYAASSAGFLRLDLDSTSWTQLSGPLQGPVHELEVDPLRPNVLYAVTSVLFTSRDGGQTWTTPDFGIGAPYVSAVVTDPLRPDVLFMAGQFVVGGRFAQIIRSPDGGVTWIDYSAGLNIPVGVGGTGTGASVQALALGPTGTLFAGLSDGAFRRAADDSAWTPINDNLPGLPMLRIAIDASSRGSVYAAAAASVWLSEDAGLTWAISPLLLSYQTTSSLATDASTPGTAYLGIQGLCAPPPYLGCSGGIYKTTDGGQHWQGLPVPSALGAVQAVAVDPARPQVLLAAGFGTQNVGFRSPDGGVTWEPLANGFPTDSVSRILVDLRVPDSIYVGTNHGVTKSSDGGASWAATGLGNAAVTALAQDARSEILYAGSDLGLFSSKDAGETWTLRVSPGGVLAIAVDARSGAVYAATAKAGVQESLDGGQTWSAVGSGLPGVSVSDLALSSDGTILYAATKNGVYVFSFRGLRAIQTR